MKTVESYNVLYLTIIALNFQKGHAEYRMIKRKS